MEGHPLCVPFSHQVLVYVNVDAQGVLMYIWDKGAQAGLRTISPRKYVVA